MGEMGADRPERQVQDLQDQLDRAKKRIQELADQVERQKDEIGRLKRENARLRGLAEDSTPAAAGAAESPEGPEGAVSDQGARILPFRKDADTANKFFDHTGRKDILGKAWGEGVARE